MSVAGHDTYAYLDVSGVHGSANTLLERVTITSCDRGVQAEGGRIQLTLRDCRLRSNTQQGIYAINNLDWITLKLARCALTDNGGSGIRLTTGWIHQVFLQAEDCLIAGSTNSGFEGVNFNAAEFLRCTFTQNGSGVRNTSGISTCELRDSIVYGNSDDVVSSPSMSAYWVQGCDIGDGDYLGQNGNFSADPLFVDAAAHDFRLKWSSPCVDVALTAPAAEARDLDGHARDVDGNLDTNERADVGAFEFRPLELVGTAQLGTLLQWKLWGPQGNATTLYWTRSALAATPTSTPFGHLDLVPSLARIYRVTTVGASAPTVIQRSIPNAIALVGQTFAFQALTDNASAPSGKAYTNAFQFTVLP
jgi:hypothetical protein